MQTPLNQESFGVKKKKCDRKCRFELTDRITSTYVCSAHGVHHVCDATCQTREPGVEGEFCYLTGIEKHGPACMMHDFTHNCTRAVRKPSRKAKEQRRLAVVQKIQQNACPISVVAEVVRRLFCCGCTRTSAAAKSAAKVKQKLIRTKLSSTLSLTHVMAVLRGGISTAPAAADSPWAVAVAAAIVKYAKRLDLTACSISGAASFPVVLTATVCSKMMLGETINGTVLIPKVKWVGRHGFPDVCFSQFNVGQ